MTFLDSKRLHCYKVKNEVLKSNCLPQSPILVEFLQGWGGHDRCISGAGDAGVFPLPVIHHHAWKLKVEKSVIISVVGLELVSGEVDLKTGSKISLRVNSLEGGQTSKSGGGPG